MATPACLPITGNCASLRSQALQFVGRFARTTSGSAGTNPFSISPKMVIAFLTFCKIYAINR